MRHCLILLLTICFCVGNCSADEIFFDDFNSGPSVLWASEFGSWYESGGQYFASSPNNFPNAHSSLPFQLTDFTVEVDVTNANDGGIWLRSEVAANGIGRTGVLLVTLGGINYFHIVTGSGYGASINPYGVPGTSYNLRVEVSGNDYQTFINGASSGFLSTDIFSSGKTAVYSNSFPMGFDNFRIDAIPEPGSCLLVAGLFSLACIRRKR